MTTSESLQYCMAEPGAEQSAHDGQEVMQIRTGDVLFAVMRRVGNRPAVSLKISPELAELLRQQYGGVRPSHHLNGAH